MLMGFIKILKIGILNLLLLIMQLLIFTQGLIDLKPAGYWKYEVYEVSWTGSLLVASGRAPASETDVLSPAASSKGIVQGLVTKGKMYVADASGTAQVQYNQYEEPTTTNYIYYGQ
jgi:hypothetical protein